MRTGSRPPATRTRMETTPIAASVAGSPVSSVTRREGVRAPVRSEGAGRAAESGLTVPMAQLATVTATLVLPVLPVASRTVAVTVWLPLPDALVVHGMVTGPAPDTVVV